MEEMEQINNVIKMPVGKNSNQEQSGTTDSTPKHSETSTASRSITTQRQAALDREKRTQAVKSLISRARASCLQDAIDPNGPTMTAFVGAWEEALAKVPSEYLDRCYLHAVRHHNSSFPIGAGEVASAWEDNGKAWVEEDQAKKPQGDICDHCHMTVGQGMEIVTGQDGRSLGARPCPVCNPDRYATWK